MNIDAKAKEVASKIAAECIGVIDGDANLYDMDAADFIADALLAVRNEELDKLAKWMFANSFATGHGDSMDDLLKELTWQVAEERQRVTAARNEALEEAARIAEGGIYEVGKPEKTIELTGQEIAHFIRALGTNDTTG